MGRLEGEINREEELAELFGPAAGCVVRCTVSAGGRTLTFAARVPHRPCWEEGRPHFFVSPEVFPGTELEAALRASLRRSASGWALTGRRWHRDEDEAWVELGPGPLRVVLLLP